MQVGVIGLPASGKTTLFNLLTHGHAEVHKFAGGEAEPNLGVTSVPDPRLDFLSELYHPKKTTPATVEFVDVAGMVPGAAKEKGFSPQLLDALRSVDALIHVVRAFDHPAVPHPEGSVDPARDAESVEVELILSDLLSVERRMARMAEDAKKGRNFDKPSWDKEHHLLTRLKEHLDSEQPLRTQSLAHDEDTLIRGFTFLSRKSLLLVQNVEDDAIGQPEPEDLIAFANRKKLPLISLCAQIEFELSQMSEADAEEFMRDLQICEPARDRLIRAAYETLDLISFFTFGADECRAWTIQRGDTALTAAGKIHSDLARGFIRAEVVAYEHFRECGSWVAAKEKGHFRLEGKEYVVQDGDCIVIRFSV